MATKKSKRSTSSKKSTKPASAKQTKAEATKVKAEEVADKIDNTDIYRLVKQLLF